jgi:hypothetical protein
MSRFQDASKTALKNMFKILPGEIISASLYDDYIHNTSLSTRTEMHALTQAGSQWWDWSNSTQINMNDV